MGVAAILEKVSVKVEPTIDADLIDREDRFIPYLVKEEKEIVTNAIEGNEWAENDEWYTVPKEEGRAVLTEPYDYEIDGKAISMTTISVPLVNSSGTFFGVLTADLSIDFLKGLVDAIKPAGGDAGIITDKGMRLIIYWKQTVSVIASNVELMQAQNESVKSTETAFMENSELSISIAASINELLSRINHMVEDKNQATMTLQNISAISEETAASAEQVSASAMDQQAELEKVLEPINNMNEISKSCKRFSIGLN